ncbi:MAG TPA: hypothetical protein VE961_05420 [Pyrinomonadaceae bacterium]|nr:hypothetical protein [Pyrinomonadaceae bacterium]
MRPIRSPQILLLGLFVLAALVAFSPNLNSQFLSDDFVQIGKVLHGDYAVAWGQEHGGFFRPLFIWSYVVDALIWTTRPFGYHLTNVVLHGLNAFLVFTLATRLLQPLEIDERKLRLAASAAAGLFLLHPSHSESVVWISGRADLLATLFVLLSVLGFLAYADDRGNSYLAASLGLFAVALLAKESAICTPFLILAIGLFRRAKAGRLLRGFGMFAGVLILFVAVRASFIGTLVGGYGAGQHLNFSPGWLRDRLLEAIVRSVLPPLPIEWLTVLSKPLHSPRFYLLLLLLFAATATAIIWRRRIYSAAERKDQNRFLLLITALFLLALLPVINLRLSLYSTQGERFLYLPTVFACMLIAYLAILLIQRAVLCMTLLVALGGFYSWNIYRVNRLWQAAAQLSSQLADSLARQNLQAPVTILNAPDNLRGVPVFHNGLPEAVRWRRPEDAISQIEILAFQDLQSETDEIHLDQTEALTLSALNANDKFSRAASTACYEVIAATSDSLQVRRTVCATPGQTFFYSSGKIHNLDER